MVEDSEGDIRLTKEALKEGKVKNRLIIARDGVEAMEILKKKKLPDEDFPDLILLDLNLPKKDGREVLDEIKSDPILKTIPVVILTTSKAEEDIIRTYNNHANAYITKPVDLTKFFEVIRSIQHFWFQIVKLPIHI